MRAIFISLILLFAGIVLTQGAYAHSTVCPSEAALKFRYGPKVRAIIWAPREKGGDFRESVDKFFERSDYFVSGVESGDVGDPSDPYIWDQLPQSPSFDISFHIETRNNRDFAIVTLSTFSFDCAETEDWRPHWVRFRDHLLTSKFRMFLAWRPFFQEVCTGIAGSGCVPLAYARSFVFVNRIAGFFSET
jgi:hypothetical protein